jgi:hypothetical protein
MVIDNLGLIPHSSNPNFGQIDNSNASWTGIVGETDFSATKRLKFNGKGADIGVYSPAVRSLYFSVLGDVTIKIWFKASGSSARTLYITDGTNLIGSYPSPGNNSDALFYKVDYVGGAKTLYVFGAGDSFNLYKMEVSPSTNIGTTTLGVKQFEQTTAVNVYSSGDRIYVKNVKSPTTVEIYSVLGALVKSIETSTDTNFEFKTGYYLATIKAEDGQKVVKLVTQ